MLDLRPEQKEIFDSERSCLTHLLEALNRMDAEQEDLEALRGSLRRLDQLFLLVVVGEFNSGKSAFINALLGEPVLREGVTPTTSRIHLLKQKDRTGESLEEELEVVPHDSSFLRHLEIVDTPGTNAIEREHELLTERFIPRADLVLFVTSADRPFTESERQFLTSIRQWGKKILFVVNKSDLLESDEEKSEVREFVRGNARRLLDTEPELFFISAREAQRLRSSRGEESDPEFQAVETYIRETLDEAERVRLKLLSPLGVAERLVEKYRESVAASLEVLQQDITFIEGLEQQQSSYRKDLQEQFRLRLSDLDQVLNDFEQRGLQFFEDRIRLGRIPDLLNKSRIQHDFENEVVAGMPRAIEEKVEDLIDWMIREELGHWETVMRRLNRHRTHLSEEMAGEVNSRFEYDRARLIDTVGREAEKTMQGYDRQREAAQLAERVQMAVAGAALAEAGAVGLGTAVGFLATSTLADVTGIMAAGALAVLGLLVIPSRRARAGKELHRKIRQMKEKLRETLSSQFERELKRSLERVDSALAPYTRFVRSEEERFQELTGTLQDLATKIDRLRERI